MTSGSWSFTGRLLLLWSVIAILSAGCSLFGDKDETPPEKEEQYTLKVLYSDEQNFMQKYGYIFMAKYGHIDVEVVPESQIRSFINATGNEIFISEDQFGQWVEHENFDILVGGTASLNRLANDGQLYDLDLSMRKDPLDIDDFHPVILEYIRWIGGGKLFFLAPSVHTEALYVNTDLFRQHGIGLPDSFSRWEDVFLLAQRFPMSGDEKTRIYGYSQYYANNAYGIVSAVSRSMGLTWTREGRPTIDTPAWRNLLELVKTTYDKGVIQPFIEATSLFYEQQLFRHGRVAITRGNIDVMRDLSVTAMQGTTGSGLNWEVRSLPASPSSINFALHENFAIRAKSSNIEAAWTLLKFIHGDEVARVNSRNPLFLSTRTTYQHTRSGVSLEPFYELSFNRDQLEDETGETFNSVANILKDELERFILGRSTMDEAIANLGQMIEQQLQNVATPQ